MLTTYEERELIFDSLRAGASGYMLKNTLRSELLQAVEQVEAGGAPMSMPIARKLVGYFQEPPSGGSDVENLTEREQEILTQLAKGLQYKEIADNVGVKLETVRSHIKHIYDKLHVRYARRKQPSNSCAKAHDRNAERPPRGLHGHRMR